MIFDILKNSESAEENGLDDLEIGYYESILKQNMINMNIQTSSKKRRRGSDN